MSSPDKLSAALGSERSDGEFVEAFGKVLVDYTKYPANASVLVPTGRTKASGKPERERVATVKCPHCGETSRDKLVPPPEGNRDKTKFRVQEVYVHKVLLMDEKGMDPTTMQETDKALVQRGCVITREYEPKDEEARKEILKMTAGGGKNKQFITPHAALGTGLTQDLPSSRSQS